MRPHVTARNPPPPSQAAVYSGQASVVAALLRYIDSEDTDAADTSGATALHIACHTKFASHEMAKLLLDGKCDPTQRDNEGCTPLHYAAALPADPTRLALVRLLVERGADVGRADVLGCVP